jgi:hypothetical protein
MIRNSGRSVDPDKPVENPEEFYGQQQVLRRIFARVGTERPQSVAVIGGAKAGKTSLLAAIAHPEVRGRYLRDEGRHVFCRLDSGNTLNRDAEGFLAGACGLLAGSCGGANPYTALQKIVEARHARGELLVLLLDDFHLITGSPKFPLEFFSFLRSLANNYNLAYITTSFLELQKLCVVKDIEESPFFNIFTNLSLGPLAAEEACRLLADVTGRGAEEVRELAAWSGGYPYVLKLVARELGAGMTATEPEKTLLPVLAPYFERIVSILPADAFNPLKSVARGKAPDPREAHLLRPLVKQGFLAERGEDLVAFAPSFAAFLRARLARKLLAGRG